MRGTYVLVKKLFLKSGSGTSMAKIASPKTMQTIAMTLIGTTKASNMLLIEKGSLNKKNKTKENNANKEHFSSIS